MYRPIRRLRPRRIAVAIALIGGLAVAAPCAGAATKGIWLTTAEIAALPTTGAAWQAVKGAADGPLGSPNLADNNSDHDVRTLAVALVYARLGASTYRAKAAAAIAAAMGTEVGGQALALGRNLVGYVIAADLIDLAAHDPPADSTFRAWLAAVRNAVFSDGSLVSKDEQRPNNHGRVAGASRAAIAAYLGDVAEIGRAAQVFKGWLGDRSSYNGFSWNDDLSWAADPTKPVGVNPLGSTKEGHSIDGALPEEMRRGCSFRWPPCYTGYPWGAIQGALIEAQVLHRLGYDTWTWEAQALRRAVDFLWRINGEFGGWWAAGDDAWQPWLVNFAYGTSYPTTAAGIGKTMGWTDWTHAEPGAPPAPTAPVNVSLPSVSGGAAVGATLVANPGGWSGSPVPTLELRWLECDGSGNGCVPISGAVSQQYSVTANEVGSTLRVEVTGSNSEGSAVAVSNRTAVVTAPPPVSTLTFVPLEDAFVRSKPATENNGTSSILRVRAGSTDFDSYLLFDVVGLSGSVESAKLRLRTIDGGPDGGTVFETTSATWDEASITWSSRPGFDTGSPLSSIGPVAAGAWVEIDVTAVVQGNGPVSLAISNLSSDRVDYSSREGSSPPQLVVVQSLGPPPEPEAPVNVSPPSVSGTAAVGAMLVADSGSWTGSPTPSLAFSWLRCDEIGNGCVPINGAANDQYVVTTNDAGSTLRLEVTASNTEGSAVATSDPTAIVTTPPTPPPVSERVFVATADAWVRSTSPTSNEGSKPYLRVRGGSTNIDTYLTFDVSGLPGPASSAILRLFVVDGGPDSGTVFTAAGAWQESTITWSSAPGFVLTPSVGGPVPAPAGTWIEIDVSATVTGEGTYRFVLSSSSSDLVEYTSREGANAPELAVTLGP